jgi:hypothetical protein
MAETNPETGSEIEMEDDGDFTVTFSMALPDNDNTEES